MGKYHFHWLILLTDHVFRYSLDNGKTWKVFPTYPVENTYALGGAIAISPDGSNVVWWPFQNTAYYTGDLGQTWIPAKGIFSIFQ